MRSLLQKIPETQACRLFSISASIDDPFTLCSPKEGSQATPRFSWIRAVPQNCSMLVDGAKVAIKPVVNSGLLQLGLGFT